VLGINGTENRVIVRAEIVFRGSITEIRESEIVFRVNRVWKGLVGAVMVMPKIEWRDTPCMPGLSGPR